MILLGYLLVIANLIFSVIRYLIAFINVEQNAVSTNLGYILVASILPFVWWAYSTKEDYWSYYNRKKKNLRMVVINAILTLMSPVWTLVFDTLVIRACRLPVGRNMDQTMILNLGRIFLVLIPGAIGSSIAAAAFSYFRRQDVEPKIEELKWQLIFDTRKNKEWKYDLSIIRDLHTGMVEKIREADRFVHMLIPGVSGSGKTSSILKPSMINDLNNKVRNMVQRHKMMVKMILEKKARVTRPEKGRGIDEWCVVANPGFEQELQDIKDTYRDCGMTVMAPDNDMHEDIIKLAKARHLKINAIDPLRTYKEKNVKNCCINPFYIPDGLTNEERLIRIIEKAQTFADVIVAVNDLSGSGETYFKDINKSVTTNIATVCMIHARLNNTQTCMSEVQTCIDEMSRLQEVVDEVEEHLHIKIKTFDFTKKKDSKGTISAEDVKEMEKGTDNGKFEFYPVEDESEMPDWAKEQGLTVAACNEVLLQEANSYYGALHSIRTELLGTGAEDMFGQTRGLRNIMSKLMTDPRIRRVFNGKEDNLLDFEEALKRNEITVINTGIRIGADNSTGLGLFMLMMLKIATFRRPKGTITPHFLYVDEASQYMHPVYEDMFALFRKYQVACILALQTLSQMDKTPTTRYLKGVLTGAGIHIVYGRVAPEEQKFYEEMGGKHYIEQMQQSTSENSEFDPRYNITRSTRSSMTLESIAQSHTLRKRNFQEVTVFMIKDGNVRDAFLAKTFFPSDAEFQERETAYANFKDYATFDMDKEAPIRTYTKQELSAKQIVEKNALRAKTLNRRKDEVLHMADLKDLDDETMRKEIEEQKNILREKYGIADKKAPEDASDSTAENKPELTDKDEQLLDILKRYGYGQTTKEENDAGKNAVSKKTEEEKQNEDKKEPLRDEVLAEDNFKDIFADMGIDTVIAPARPNPKKKEKKGEDKTPNAPKNGKNRQKKKELKGQTNIFDDDAMELIKNSFGNKVG